MNYLAFILLATLYGNIWASGIYQGPPVDKNVFVPVLTKTEVQYETMTVNEVLSMEPACLVIGMGRATGRRWGLPENMFPKGAGPRFEDYPMLTNAPWFHHYCWGELDRFRYFTTSNPEAKTRYLKRWVDGILYSLNDAKKRGNNSWPYLNKLRGDLAAAQLESKKYIAAIATATEVIAAAPEIEATHTTLIDALIALKKKTEAEAASLEAMKRFGKNKSLVRRYKALTGREPDIPDPEPEPAPVAAVDSPVPTPAAAPAPKQDAPAMTTAADPALAVLQSVTPPAKIGNVTNPYCRFCPDPALPKP